MTSLLVLAARRAASLLVGPSVPPVLQSRVLAAMQGRTPSPVPGRWQGKPRSGTGHVTEGTSPLSVTSQAGPEGTGPCPAPALPVHPELLLNWRPMGPHRAEMTDAAMADMLTAWAAS